MLEKARDVLHVDFRETPLDLVAIAEALGWAEKWYLFNMDLIDSSNKGEVK